MKALAWCVLAIVLILALLRGILHTQTRLGIASRELVGATADLVVTVINPNNTGNQTTNPTPASTASGSLGTPITNATLNVSGRAYPYSAVTLLKDGVIALSTVAGGDARFSLSLTNLTPGSYIFSIYGADSANRKSAPLSFPTTLTTGAITSIDGIFLSPTLDTDKTQVRKGDTVSFFGAGTPSSTITIAVNSDSGIFLNTHTDSIGVYLYKFDTTVLNTGDHTVKAKVTLNSDISDYSNTVAFSVGDITTQKKQAGSVAADLNGDGRINIVDFSIMAYWYKRPLSGTGLQADLNHDGKVDLTDFSILMSHWTG